MKLSVNTLRKLNQQYGSAGDPAADGVDKLIEKIGAQLGGVEEITKIGAQYDGAVIVKVVSCDDHPNADRLHVCMIDDGGAVENVTRSDNGLVQVVCGAPNVAAGVTVVWLPPGATVPSTYNEDPFVLEARELRGVVSNGMLASPKELAIGDSHEGLLIIDEDVAPGTKFGEYYYLSGDVIIDIENKMFTHRPDCFGWLGVAREIAGIRGEAYHSPDWYRVDAELPQTVTHDLALEVRNEVPDVVPRYMAVPLSGITTRPSPVWLQTELSRVGIRPINNIVDLTNYYMVLTGQPLHAYDYDKVRALDGNADHATIVVRKPQDDENGGEKLTLLSGKEVEPRADAIIIATQSQAIGLAGVMGGGNTEVDGDTKNIILECASFNMYSIRKTSMHSGIFTDAVTRFNKGQSPLQNRAVLSRIVTDLITLCGGQVAGDVIDDNHLPEEVLERSSLHPEVTVSAHFINSRLGLQLPVEEMARLLTNVEFSVRTEAENLVVKAPFWRTDIEIAEDIVEEIGRLYGFDKLPLELPQRSITPAHKNSLLEAKSALRNVLSSGGANEVLTYSFVHGNLLDTATQNKELAFKLSNALSPDLQYYRMSITPSLLERVTMNIRAGYGEFALFELGKAHIKGQQDMAEPTVPAEMSRVGFVYAADNKVWSKDRGAPYYQAKKYVGVLLEKLGLPEVRIRLAPLSTSYSGGDPVIDAWVAPYEPLRSALVFYDFAEPNKTNTLLGIVGEIKGSIKKSLKLPTAVVAFELDSVLLDVARSNSGGSQYVPLPRYPSVSQDISLKVPAAVSYQAVYDCIWGALTDVLPADTLPELQPLDIYQRDNDPDHKRITLRLTIASYEKTMTDTEVTKLLDTMANTAQTQLGAERL